MMTYLKHGIVPVLVVVSLFSCKRAVLEGNAKAHFAEIIKNDAPLVGRTSLADTLPAEVLAELGVGEVNGVKLAYGNNRDVRYYAYESDADVLIGALSRLAFTKYAVVADTTCYKTSFAVVDGLREGLSPVEQENSAFFWEASREAFEVYECLKAPVRHTVLVNRRLGLVYHRVEKMG